MLEKADLERMATEIPVKRLTSLRKDVRKYEEQVNKCDIFETNILAESIGGDVDYLKYSGIRTTEEQKQELKNLEDQLLIHMDDLKRCRCVRKLEK